MPNIQKPTSKQHYVPQVYLRGFSQDQKRIYRYDLKTGFQKREPVSISSVCFLKDMYEFTDEKGKKLGVNYIEKCFCEFEAIFSQHINKLKTHITHKPDNNSLFVMDSDESAFWTAYTAIQILRSPWILSATYEWAEEYLKEQSSNDELQTIDILLCLPFLKDLIDKEGSLFKCLISSIKNLSIVIGIDKNDRIFTSDNPVYCYGDNLNSIEKIIFPLSSNLVLFFLSDVYINTFDKILFFDMGDYDINETNLSISYAAQSCILSKYLLNEMEIKQIKQAQQDKKNDEEGLKCRTLT